MLNQPRFTAYPFGNKLRVFMSRIYNADIFLKSSVVLQVVKYGGLGRIPNSRKSIAINPLTPEFI